MHESDRLMREQHLAQAERHVSEGEKYIARQRAIVEELVTGGHDATSALRLLVQFEGLQALHIDDRDRLRKELGRAG